MNDVSEVDSWFEVLDHPQKETMQAIRRAIIGADERMSESIQWKVPTYSYTGNLRAFNLPPGNLPAWWCIKARKFRATIILWKVMPAWCEQ